MRNFSVLRGFSFILLIVISQACAAFSQKTNVRTANNSENPPVIRPENNRMLHREGTRIVDGAGQPVALKGVNLGGWLMWEGWIFGSGFISESQIINRLTLAVGKEEAQRFQADIHNNFVTEADFQELARLGFNVVRLPINHTLLEDDDRPYVYKESGWRVLDQTLNWAERNKIYVVLDLHGAPGGQNNGFISDPEFGNSLWKSAENKKRTVALWRAIAERYKNRQIVAGYDLLNEPKPPRAEDLVDLYRDIIAAVREVDRAHLIFLEGTENARDFTIFDRRLDENMAYSFHMYTWFGKKRESDRFAELYAAAAQKHDVPLWCGEFGEDQPAEISRLVNLYSSNRANSGWAFWTWKKAPNRTPALDLIAEPASWKKLADWIEHPLLNRKPSKPEAQQALREFLEAVRFQNTTVNRSMADVLR